MDGLNLTAEQQFKVPVVQRPNYTLSLERANKETTFVHCDFTGQWTKASKRQLQEDWHTLKALHHHPLYAQHDPEDHKHEKFISMFGLRYTATYVDALTGRTTQIFST